LRVTIAPEMGATKSYPRAGPALSSMLASPRMRLSAGFKRKSRCFPKDGGKVLKSMFAPPTVRSNVDRASMICPGGILRPVFCLTASNQCVRRPLGQPRRVNTSPARAEQACCRSMAPARSAAGAWPAKSTELLHNRPQQGRSANRCSEACPALAAA